MDKLRGEKKISICNHLSQHFHASKMVFIVETQALMHGAHCMLHAWSCQPEAVSAWGWMGTSAPPLWRWATQSGAEGVRVAAQGRAGDPDPSEKGDTVNILK